MAKSFVHINKIKTYGTLKSRWNHDLNVGFRMQHVDNADPEKNSDNDILVTCTDDEGNELSYERAVKKRLQGKTQSNGKAVRKDAVIAYDIVLEFGDIDDIENEGIDVEEWERRSVKWLKDIFNVAGDGKDNVISVVCHKDEASPHIHAIVTPVNEKGNLCAKSFTDGSAALRRLQTSYAQRLSDLGIERGIEGSSAHQKSNKRYKAEKEKAAKIPEPQPEQTAQEYFDLYNAELSRKAVEQKEKYDKLERQLRARNDMERIQQTRAMGEETKTMLADIYEKKDIIEAQLEDTQKQVVDNKRELNRLISEKEQIESELEDVSNIKTKVKLYEYQRKIMEYTKITDPELYEDITSLYEDAEQEYLDAELEQGHEI